MILLAGQKRKKLFTEFIEKYFPSDIHDYVYIEPFGGTFSISTFLKNKPKKLVYNDITSYDFPIVADEKLKEDYSDVLNKFCKEKSFFYLDPPYYGKEHLYGKERFDYSFHTKLRDDVLKSNAKTVISYEDNKFIREIWDGHEIVKYSGDNQVFRNEILIIVN